MTTYVSAVEYFPNCPVHDSGYFSKLVVHNSENELLEYALENINIYHIMDTVLIENQDVNIYVKYLHETHKYNAIEYFIDDVLIKKTEDNGSGTIIWKDVEN